MTQNGSTPREREREREREHSQKQCLVELLSSGPELVCRRDDWTGHDG